MSPLQKHLFTLCNSVFNGLLGIFRKVVIPDYQLVELVPQEVGTCGSSMAIVHCEKGTPGPLVHLLELWLDDVENNANSVLIVISHDTLMSVGRIATYHSILLAGKLGRMVAINVPFYLFLLHFHVFLLLLDSHDKSSISN